MDTNADALVVSIVGRVSDAFVRPKLTKGLRHVKLLESVLGRCAANTRGVLHVVPNLFQEPVHGVQGVAQGHAQALDVVLRQNLPPPNHNRDDARQNFAIRAEASALAIPLDP